MKGQALTAMHLKMKRSNPASVSVGKAHTSRDGGSPQGSLLWSALKWGMGLLWHFFELMIGRVAGFLKSMYRCHVVSLGKGPLLMSDRFNVDSEAIRQLAELLNSTGLSEIEYEVDAGRIRVAKAPLPSAFMAAPSSPQPVVSSGVREDGPPAMAKPSASHAGAVKSPMVGTVYLSPSPGMPPFVKVGDTVAKGDTLLIIEAMKVMNPIRSPQAGRVKEFSVKDAEPVEFGTILLVIE